MALAGMVIQRACSEKWGRRRPRAETRAGAGAGAGAEVDDRAGAG